VLVGKSIGKEISESFFKQGNMSSSRDTVVCLGALVVSMVGFWICHELLFCLVTWWKALFKSCTWTRFEGLEFSCLNSWTFLHNWADQELTGRWIHYLLLCIGCPSLLEIIDCLQWCITCLLLYCMKWFWCPQQIINKQEPPWICFFCSD